MNSDSVRHKCVRLCRCSAPGALVVFQECIVAINGRTIVVSILRSEMLMTRMGSPSKLWPWQPDTPKRPGDALLDAVSRYVRVVSINPARTIQRKSAREADCGQDEPVAGSVGRTFKRRPCTPKRPSSRSLKFQQVRNPGRLARGGGLHRVLHW